MKPITKAIIIAVIIIGILGNIALVYFAVNNLSNKEYVGAVVPLLCCIYSCYYLVQLFLIYANAKEAEKHSKIAKENYMGPAGYIARDSTGHLYYYEYQPVKNKELGIWESDYKKAPLPYTMYQDVRWEDEKPLHILLPQFYFEN